MKVKLKDVALRAGVSASTVSRVLNGASNVSPAARENVLKGARALGYHRGGGRGRTVAVLIPGDREISFCGYLSMLLTAMSRNLYAAGYRMELVCGNDLELLSEKFIIGGISAMYMDGFERRWRDFMNLPLVCLNSSSLHGDNIYSVCSDERQGMRMALELLKRHGHSRIGLLYNGNPDTWCNRARITGCETAATKLGMTLSVKNCADVERIYEPIGKLLQTGVTGLICTGEGMGSPVAYALDMFGKRIPRDLSLITHELAGVSSFCIPQHSTVSQDFQSLSQAAVKMLENLLAGRRPEGDVLVDCLLIERDSTGKAPPAQDNQ